MDGSPFLCKLSWLVNLANGFCSQKSKNVQVACRSTRAKRQKPGKFEKSEFTAIFKRVKLSELEGVSEAEGVSLLKKVLVGWEGINDEDGDPVEFSEAELDDFSDDVDWLKAVLAAYTKTYGEAEAGN